MLRGKIIKIGQCFTELFEKCKWHFFMDNGVSEYEYLQGAVKK